MAISIVLRHYLCPGDTVVMTVVPRELHRRYPGMFEVSVQTSHPDVWIGNKYIVNSFGKGDRIPPHYHVINLGYNPRDESTGDTHFMHSYLGRAAELLSEFGVTDLPLTEFRPHIRLTQAEKDTGPSPSGVLRGHPYWLLLSGGKRDITAKWWDRKCWQSVAYSLASDDKFPLLAQVGRSADTADHPIIEGCVGLVDKTSLRQLIWLTYHSRGVICGVTSLMHIAAALRKPAVVVAGGREAWWWDSYGSRSFERHSSSIPSKYHRLFPLRPNHIYLDTIGKLTCCDTGGCWKSGIGEQSVGKNCTDIIKPEKYSTTQSIPQPRCMTMITPKEVVKSVYKLEVLKNDQYT